jgi:hypothetical protein
MIGHSRTERRRIEACRALMNSRSLSFVDGARAATMRPNSGTRSKTKAILADEARWLNSLPPFVFRARSAQLCDNFLRKP